MWLKRLTVEGIRNLTSVDIDLDAGVHFFVGDNGAGKTSVLESVYCLSSGRSFRSGSRSEFLSRERREATIFGDIHDGDRHFGLGLSRTASDWKARRDGAALDNLGDLARSLAVLCFHPSLHHLIEGSPEERRWFLDFGVFHVEHTFLDAWRQFRRALKQRNAALRSPGSDHRLWDPALVSGGEAVTDARARVADRLSEGFDRMLSQLGPELEGLVLEFYPGWRRDQGLAEQLQEQGERDRHQAHTTAGPHRADLQLRDADGRVAGRLSRGQQKIVVLAMTLAMRQLLGDAAGSVPVLGVDDFASELDENHQQLVLAHIAETPGQVLLTGTAVPACIEALRPPVKLFHVEHGQVREVI